MTNKQADLIKQLSNILLLISDECIEDDNFNNEIADLNIFSKSIDEVAYNILRKID